MGLTKAACDTDRILLAAYFKPAMPWSALSDALKCPLSSAGL